MNKKSFSLMSIALLGAMTIVGCGEHDNRPVLIYRSWDTGTKVANNEERQLIRAFERKENVRVKIVDDPGQGTAYWDGIDASVIRKEEIADVFMLPSLDKPLASQYLLNIKEYTDADEEFANISASLRETCAFKSGVYALPARMNLQGYFANTTLIEESLGIDADNLSVNSSFSDIEAIIDKADTVDGVFGISGTTHFIDTMASVLDTSTEKTMGYFTWDGSQYHLNSQAFIQGVQKAREIFDAKKTIAAYSSDELAEYDVTDAVDAWNKSKLALRYGYTYEMPDMMAKKLPGSSYKFIGNPGGKITIVPDYYGIYVGTKKPELAYKLAKWMSFGSEGFTKRMELYAPSGAINTLPIQNDATIINNYFDNFGSSSEMRGMEDAFEYIKTKSMVEGLKPIPGFDASRNQAFTGIEIGDYPNASMFDLLNSCVVFGGDITQYADQINTIANNQYTSWMNTHGKKYQ